MKVPDIYQLLLLIAAAYRVWRLLAEDDILDRPRRAILRLGEWRQEGDKIPDNCRLVWSKFVGCPWCFGAWIAFAWWGFFEWDAHWTTVVAAPWAISAGVGAIAHYLNQ